MEWWWRWHGHDEDEDMWCGRQELRNIQSDPKQKFSFWDNCQWTENSKSTPESKNTSLPKDLREWFLPGLCIPLPSKKFIRMMVINLRRKRLKTCVKYREANVTGKLYGYRLLGVVAMLCYYSIIFLCYAFELEGSGTKQSDRHTKSSGGLNHCKF